MLFGVSLARKSGKITMGFDAVKDAVKEGRAAVVLIAKDISDGTVRRVKNTCGDRVPVYLTDYTQYDYSKVVGRLTGLIAVTDENLAKLCTQAIEIKKESLNGN